MIKRPFGVSYIRQKVRGDKKASGTKMALTLAGKCDNLSVKRFNGPLIPEVGSSNQQQAIITMTDDRKKYIEQWWRKYEAMGDLDAEFPPSREVFFDFVESAYDAWIKTGKTTVQIEADIEHHIAMQKIFQKWREVHGEKI